MTRKNSGDPYYSYIIRAWREQDSGSTATWRYLLIDSRTGERRGFKSPEMLAAYLHEKTHTEIPLADNDHLGMR